MRLRQALIGCNNDARAKRLINDQVTNIHGANIKEHLAYIKHFVKAKYHLSWKDDTV